VEWTPGEALCLHFDVLAPAPLTASVSPMNTIPFRDILRREFDAEEGSFMLQARSRLKWDTLIKAIHSTDGLPALMYEHSAKVGVCESETLLTTILAIWIPCSFTSSMTGAVFDELWAITSQWAVVMTVVVRQSS